MSHWAGCPANGEHTWNGRRYCRTCGCWLERKPIPTIGIATTIVGEPVEKTSRRAVLGRCSPALGAKKEPRPMDDTCPVNPPANRGE